VIALGEYPTFRELLKGEIVRSSLNAVNWCKTVLWKQVRRSVTLPEPTARKMAAIAHRHRLSDNRVMIQLIEEGIATRKEKEKLFFEIAECFRASQYPVETKRLGEELGRFMFGE
jgi:hypothetical protein